MTEAQQRFDRDVASAWREFRGLLADHVAAMTDGDGLVLEPFTDESAGPAGPCVQFYAWGAGQVRCEVPSNTHLGDDRRLRPEDEALLLTLGWQSPSRGPEDPEDGGSPAFWMDRPASWADQLAEVAVTVLREVWGVVHPLFLRAETFGADPVRSFEPPAPAPEVPPRPVMPRVVDPLGEEELRGLIEQTVSDRVGETPVWDEDGDLVLRMAGVLVFVGVSPGGATVDVLAPVVHSVTGRTRASEVLADLNRQWPHLKFVLVDDRVAVVDHVQAAPFVAEHLLVALDRLGRFLEGLDPTFAAHLGGVSLCAPEHDDAPSGLDDDAGWTPDLEAWLPRPLLDLRDHHLGEHPRVSTTVVAALADWKSSQLRYFLDLSTEQHIGWTSEALDRAAVGDAAGTAEADTKALEWERTSRSLTAALHLLERSTAAPRPARGDTDATDQPGLFDIPDEPTLFDGFGD